MGIGDIKIDYVVTPTEKWLRGNLKVCKSRFLVASPFVTTYFKSLLLDINSVKEKVLVTRTDIRDFVLGSSDLEALYKMSESGVSIRSLEQLHAKVYVIDSQKALITSANATAAGMRTNIEFGIAIENSLFVQKIADQVLSGFGSGQLPEEVTLEELDILIKVSKKVRPILPSRLKIEESIEKAQSQVRLEYFGTEELLQDLSGWLKLTLRGVLTQEKESFNLDNLFRTCKPWARKDYPDNKHVRAKLRQQLQRLRDFGLVEFLGNGVYKTTLECKK